MTGEASGFTVVPLTPAGCGAVAAIRLHGQGVRAALRSIFVPRRRSSSDTVATDRLTFGRFVDGDETLDEGITAVREDGRGGHIAELTVHGGVRVVERMLLVLERVGGKIETRPPSFDGRRTLIDVEAEATLARCKTRRAVRFIARQRTALPEGLRDILNECERSETRGRAMLADLMERSRSSRYLVEGATVVFFGPVNAGKSTLINRLFDGAQNLVSARAGTTRDWVDAAVAIDGVPLRVIDTAGVRIEGEGDGLEAEAIERGRSRLREADVQVIVLDGCTSDRERLFERYAADLDLERAVVVANKCDLPGARAWDPIGSGCAAEVVVSGLTGEGTTLLRGSILGVLPIDELDGDGARLFTDRQSSWISQVLSDGSDGSVQDAIRAEMGRTFFG